MNILLIATEVTPYFQRGGVADVVSGLAKELNTKLLDARIIVPYYRNLLTQPIATDVIVSNLEVSLGTTTGEIQQSGAYSRNANVLKSKDKPMTYFVDQDFYFGRDDLYGYPDDYERFIFFCQTALTMLMRQEFRDIEKGWFPDIIQGYDWATGLIPGWIRKLASSEKEFEKTRFVLNIYNLRRMGIFGSRALQLAQQFESGFYPSIGERDEQINFLGRGVLFADKVVMVNHDFTVGKPPHPDANFNPLPEAAAVLESALNQRRTEGDLIGIRNGIDDEDYDPGGEDIRIAKKFTRKSLHTDRAVNKRELQRRLGLIENPDIPLLGMVGKLIPGNGFEFLQSIHDCKDDLQPVQLVVLADSAVSNYRDVLRQWENEQNSSQPWIKSRFQYDDSLARLIFAAADIFLMPVSEWPSGITQYIAMRYGAIPLVYHTGALCHSVENFVPGKTSAAEGAGIGFKFYEYSPNVFLNTLQFALSVYGDRNDKSRWRNIQLFNMQQKFNWGQPASRYETEYGRALREHATTITPGRPIQRNRDMRLLQALLEIDNLPGLGVRKPEGILKQAARIIRGVLECDAVYVWDKEKRLGQNDLEPSLDYTNRTQAPNVSQVILMLNKSQISAWGPLGDSDLNGNCQPISDLADFEIAKQQGWVAGKSMPIVAHGKLLGRIDIFMVDSPIEDQDQWQATALTALAGSLGQRLSSILDAIDMDQIARLSAELLDFRSFDDTTRKIVKLSKEFVDAQNCWLFYCDNGLKLLAGTEQHSISKMADSCLGANHVISIGDWIQAPRREDGHRLYRSLLAVPLKENGKDKSFGVIVLTHEEPFAFSHHQERLVVEFLSPQAAVALSTAVWIKARDNTRLSQLATLSESLVSSGDYVKLLNKIVLGTMSVLRAEAASLYLLNNETHMLEIMAAGGYHEPLMRAKDKPSYRLGEGVTGWIAQEGKIFKADSTEELHSKYGKVWRGKYKKLQKDREPNAFLGIPLKIGGRTIGILKLEDRVGSASETFSDEDVLLGSMMGNVIATVVHNYRFSEQTNVTKLNNFSDNIRSLSTVLAGSQNRQTLMDNIVEKIKDVLNVSAASLFLADEKRENLEIKAASGYQKNLMLTKPLPSYRWGEGVTGRIAENNKPVLANSLKKLREIGGGAKKGKYDEKQGNKQPKTFYGMPLNVEGEKRPIGVLKVENLEARPFTEEDVLLITMMGNVIAAVVHNANISERKLADFNENISQLSGVLAGSRNRQTLMDNIVEKIKDVLNVSAASLFLADEKRENLEIKAASGYQTSLMLAKPLPSYRWGEGVTGRIAQNNEPILANTTEELRQIGGANKGKYDEKQENKQPKAFYGMPLNVEGEKRPIGVLKVESLEPRPFTEEDRLLITMMGNVIAAVVYNAQISDKKLADFNEYIRQLSGVLTPEGMSTQEWFQKIVDRISDLFKTDAASLYLIDDASGSLVIAAASGYQKKLIKEKASYELGEGVTGKIADTGRSFGADNLKDLRKQGDSNRGKYDDLQGGNQPNSYYGVPLKVTGKNKPIGVLKFESLKESFFSAENRLLIDMMANVIGTVIDNNQQGEKRIRSILSDIGTLTHPIDVSSDILAKYTGEKDSGLVDQLAFALTEDLGKDASIDVEAEARQIFLARKPLDPELRPGLYERIAAWARIMKFDHVEWKFNLYHSILSSNTKKYENWNQVRDVAQDWIELKTNVGQPVKFQTAASKIITDITTKIGIAYGSGKMDSSLTWYQTILETKEMFGDEIKHILMLFQCTGELDEINQRRLASLASKDEEDPYPVLLVVQWNTAITQRQKNELRTLLADRKIDVVFADIQDILKLYETDKPETDFRRLIIKQVSIASPFVTEGDVPDNLFFGRDEEIKTLVTKSNSSYAVIGNRKIGKTSLLKKVERILILNQSVRPIYIDCTAVDSVSGFYHRFQIDSKIKLTSNTPKGFDEAVRGFAQQGGKPVFLIDEADRALTINSKESERLIRACRALTKGGVCNFVFFGSAVLAALCSNANSDLFNFATSMPLGYLSRDIARKVLLDPLEKIDVFLDDPDYITEKVFEVTSGHPNLVQKIGALLITKANQNHRRITRQHIDEICSDSSFRDYFLDIIWGVSGPLEKLITLTAPALDFTLENIVEALVKRGIRFRRINEKTEYTKTEYTKDVVLTYNRLDDSLKMLRDLSVLNEDADGYHFVPRSFQSLLKLKNPQVVENDIDARLFELSKLTRNS